MADTCDKALGLRKRCGRVSLSMDSTIRSRSRSTGVLFINPTIELRVAAFKSNEVLIPRSYNTTGDNKNIFRGRDRSQLNRMLGITLIIIPIIILIIMIIIDGTYNNKTNTTTTTKTALRYDNRQQSTNRIRSYNNINHVTINY